MKDLNHYLSLNYRRVLYRDEDQDWIAEIADLPGCIADGATSEEALRNLDSSMRSWMESRLAAHLPIPEPHEQSTYSGKILVRIPRYLHEKLAKQAEIEGVSLNQYMLSLLAEGPNRKTGNPVRYSASFVASGSFDQTGVGWLNRSGSIANCNAFPGSRQSLNLGLLNDNCVYLGVTTQSPWEEALRDAYGNRLSGVKILRCDGVDDLMQAHLSGTASPTHELTKAIEVGPKRSEKTRA